MLIDSNILDIINDISSKIDPINQAPLILVGSYARNEATENSDIDLVFIGDGIPYKLNLYHGCLISISWKSPKSILEAFSDPAIVGAIVPSLRNCVIIRDIDNIATSIKENAVNWNWDSIAEECNSWISDQLTGYAEEIHRLVDSMNSKNHTLSSVMRNEIATRIPIIMSVHLKILYESENRLWNLVNDKMDSNWKMAQNNAMGISNVNFKLSCISAIKLYSMAVMKVKHIIKDDQLQIIKNACKIAGVEI